MTISPLISAQFDNEDESPDKNEEQYFNRTKASLITSETDNCFNLTKKREYLNN